MATDVNEMTSASESEEGGMPSSAIGSGFVPAPRAGVIGAEFDGEVLLAEPESGALHVLNATGALVWSLFDAQTSLAELTGELAEAFGIPAQTVGEDVLVLTRSLGDLGLLDGVVADVPEPAWEAPALPTGIAQGEAIPPFRLPGADGTEVDLAALKGERVLLVNWSPTCGYCRKIMPDLVEVAARPCDEPLRIVLLTSGDEEANVALLSEGGLSATLAFRSEADEDFEDPFPNMGTPVAYLIDAEGRSADALAYGALEVPALARRAAGMPEPAEPEAEAAAHEHDHDHDPAGDTSDGEPKPKYLAMPASANACQPSAAKGPAREWAGTGTYRLDDLHVGIRADSTETDEVLARVFAPVRSDGAEAAPANYSVVLPGAHATSSELNLLLFGSTTLVRSRSPRRVVMALATHLSGLVALPGEDDDVFDVHAIPVVKDGRAVLLPENVRMWMEQLQPRLAKLGWAMVDVPRATIDAGRAELVVPAPSVAMDAAALAEVPDPAPRRSELAVVPSGRYPLDAWVIWGSNEGTDAPLSRAEAVASALGAVIGGPAELEHRLRSLGELFARISALPVEAADAESFVRALRIQLEAVEPR